MDINIQEYLDLKESLKELKQAELEMRLMIVDEFFRTCPEGTHYLTYGEFNLKAVVRNNITLDLKALVENELNDDEFDCLSYKTGLDKKAYDRLDPSRRETLDECIIVKPGVPTLSIKEDV